MNLPTTLTGITIIGSTLHWDIYPQLNIVKIPLKKLFSLVLTIQKSSKLKVCVCKQSVQGKLLA